MCVYPTVNQSCQANTCESARVTDSYPGPSLSPVDRNFYSSGVNDEHLSVPLCGHFALLETA